MICPWLAKLSRELGEVKPFIQHKYSYNADIYVTDTAP